MSTRDSIHKDNIPLEGEILDAGEESISANEKKVREKFWRTLAKAANQIPYMEEVIAAYYCAMDRETPNRVRAILLAALAYFILPLDSVPDFLIGFGFTDDIAVLGMALGAIRGNIAERHRIAAREKLAEADAFAKGDTEESAA